MSTCKFAEIEREYFSTKLFDKEWRNMVQRFIDFQEIYNHQNKEKTMTENNINLAIELYYFLIVRLENLICARVRITLKNYWC